MVGVGRLELPASWSRTKRATGCATPRKPLHYNDSSSDCQEKTACRRRRISERILAREIRGRRGRTRGGREMKKAPEAFPHPPCLPGKQTDRGGLNRSSAFLPPGLPFCGGVSGLSPISGSNLPRQNTLRGKKGLCRFPPARDSGLTAGV